MMKRKSEIIQKMEDKILDSGIAESGNGDKYGAGTKYKKCMGSR